jgi:hypothetical protein
MTMQYEQTSINLGNGSGATVTTLVYDPSSPQSGSSYPDWNDLMSELSTISGPKEIIIAIPPVPTAAVTVPAGTYDMSDISLVGQGLVSLRVEDAVFQNLTKITNLSISVGVAVANTVPSFVFDDGSIQVISLDRVGFAVGPNAGAELIAISGGTALFMAATDSAFSGAIGVPAITVDATSILSARPIGGTPGNSWGGDLNNEPFAVVAGGGTFSLELGTGDVFFASDNPAGPTLLARLDDYEAAGAVGVVWALGAPRNVKDALDRIAAFLATTAASPIP